MGTFIGHSLTFCPWRQDYMEGIGWVRNANSLDTSRP